MEYQASSQKTETVSQPETWGTVLMKNLPVIESVFGTVALIRRLRYGLILLNATSRRRTHRVSGMRICVFAATFLICGCSGKQDRTAETLPLPLSKLSGYENEVFPVANGNAYLVSGIERQLFLLSKDRASRIDGIELNGAEASIYPLPDGAAYLVSSNGETLRLYYLIGDKATPVQEGPIERGAVSRKSASSEAFLWVQTQAVLARYRRARTEAETASQTDDAP